MPLIEWLHDGDEEASATPSRWPSRATITSVKLFAAVTTKPTRARLDDVTYSVALGDAGPPMELSISHEGFALDEDDTCTLRYIGPDKISRTKTLEIVSATAGTLKVPSWDGDDFAVPGQYVGRVVVSRAGDETFPRTFPNDGTGLVWMVSGDVS